MVVANASGQPHIDRGRTTFRFTDHLRGRPCLTGRVIMAWMLLFVAGLLEVGWAIGLKYTEGFTRLVPSVLTLAAMTGSILLLGLALKELPIGTAYAVWTGIGAVGTAILGIVLFGDPATAARLACIGLIVAGILGLKLVTGSA
jgi:quaternary ammonium compound-resistance protein SugE